MENVLEWYQNNQSPNQPEQQVQQVSIEQELEKHEQEQQEADHVAMNEYQNCIKAVGLSELLRNNLANYLAMTQVPDLEGFKKDDMRANIKQVLNDLSNTIAEL